MVKCEEEESGMSDKNLYSKRKWCVIQENPGLLLDAIVSVTQGYYSIRKSTY